MLREPCVHGLYDAHRWCPGGRTLTDGEVMVRLLYQDCGECGGNGFYQGKSGHPLLPDDPCPSCGGSGRTLKDGVEVDMRWPGSGDWVMFPVSMLEGGE